MPIITLDKAHDTLIFGDATAKPPVNPQPYWVLVYFYAHKIAGWVLGSFLVAGLAGLTQVLAEAFLQLETGVIGTQVDSHSGEVSHPGSPRSAPVGFGAAARRKGLTLEEAVLDFWLHRVSRNLCDLLSDLELLDDAALVEQRRVTIPLIKDVLKL